MPPETAHQVLLEGVGIGFFARTQVADALAAGQLHEVLITALGPITRESALVRLARQKSISVVGTEFIAEVCEVAARARILVETIR